MRAVSLSTQPIVPEILGEHSTPFLPGLAPDNLAGSEPLGAMNFETNLLSSTPEGRIANSTVCENDAFHIPMEQIDQLEERYANNNAANPIPPLVVPGVDPWPDLEQFDPRIRGDRPYTTTRGSHVPGSGLLGAMNFDMNLWPSTVGESFANAVLSEIRIAAELEVLMKRVHQIVEHRPDYNPTNPMLASAAPGASASSQPPSQGDPSMNPLTAPAISSDHQSYLCSWEVEDSGAQCGHVAPDKPAFLRHLNEEHQVSGNQGTRITCLLLDGKTGLACKASRKRGCFPRHVDTHYPLRYNCRYCPGTSFARQDTWKKHVNSKHGQTPSAPLQTYHIPI